ncbi:MAG: DNA primase [Gammaproteobacteria bacterium]
MARIPQAFIDDLVTRIDIVQVIDARVPLKKQGREFVACCPFHNEKTPSFTVSPSKQFYHCFGCGAHGTALGFLMDYEHMDFLEAVHALADQAGVQIPVDTVDKASDGFKPMYALLERVAHQYGEELRNSPAAVAYLKQRGVNGEIAAEFGLGYAPPGWDSVVKSLGNDAETHKLLVATGLAIENAAGGYHARFRARVMFPIRDGRGRVIAFGGRVLDKEEPKYLNSPETPLFHKGRELYGLYEARQALRDIPHLLVVEGYMDVVALHQHGLRYAVATLGTATTTEHVQKLFRITEEVVFCFDGDHAGRSAAWRALENVLPEARQGRQIRFLFLPEGEDPDTLVRKEGRERFEARLVNAVPLSAFLFDHLGAQTDLGSLDGRARLVELARPLLGKLPAGVYKEMLKAELAKRAGLDPEKLTILGTGLGRGTPGRAPQPAGRVRLTGPVRKALALLLSRPGLAALCEAPGGLVATGLKGADLLTAVVEFAQANPHITGAGLLEHWRDTDTGSYLMKLAQAELVTPPEAMESEFRAVLADLTARRPAEQRLDELLTASRTRALEAPEKAELADLLKMRGRGGSQA